MALIGNLIQAGAGSNEMRDAAIASQNMKSVGRAVGGIAKGIAKAPISMINAGNSASKLGVKETLKKSLGIKTDNDFKREGWAGTKEEQEQASQKEEQKQEKPTFYSIKDIILRVNKLIKDGLSLKQAAKEVARQNNLQASLVYNTVVESKRVK